VFPALHSSKNHHEPLHPYLKPLGLTYTQYLVFLVLWEQDGITVSEICKKLMLDSGTLSPLLKKMQQSGYLVKFHSKEDERAVFITLTEKGRELQEFAKDIPLQVGSCTEFPADKAKVLYDLLYELLNIQHEKNA
jgi:DNA-binding MarR family transcriptional regulator